MHITTPVAPEPAGPAGRLPALGGFSLAVASQASDPQQKAAWIFIQWATSEDIARPYVEAGGVSGRMSIYEQPDIKAKYKFVEPMVASWQKGVPEFRPRFPAWPAISEVIGVPRPERREGGKYTAPPPRAVFSSGLSERGRRA